jgi:hypothetical protein
MVAEEDHVNGIGVHKGASDSEADSAGAAYDNDGLTFLA